MVAFGISLLLGVEPGFGFLFAVGVTVALVPEGLLPTVTLSLARATQLMAGRHALVRRLESVETLGSTTFVCTDKTGTLTRNEMNVVEVWTPKGAVRVSGVATSPRGECSGDAAAVAAARELRSVGRRVRPRQGGRQDGQWRASGDPMEAAIHAFAVRVGAGAAADVRIDRALPLRPACCGGRPPWQAATCTCWVPPTPSCSTAPRQPAPIPPAPSARSSGSALPGSASSRWRGADSWRPMPTVAAEDGAVSAQGRLEHALELLGLVAMEDPPRAGVSDAHRGMPTRPGSGS